ncbi:hypothetical protein [uncultured Nostoc sp.]|uniref:hypothetical protein n=1 Tax=uncultured Nostoc sp. TaxID=340711 RepID=UPI0035CA0506
MTNHYIDPILEKITSRQQAITAKDPNANVCHFATVASNNGKLIASVRAINLHTISGRSFEFHCSEQSEKWKHLQLNSAYEFELWLPSVGRNYRIQGELEIMPKSLVEQNWSRSLYSFKILDCFYEEYQPLGSKLQSQELLLSSIDSLKTKNPIEEQILPPKHLRGFYCKACQIDALYISEDRLHERHHYSYIDNNWHHELRVP